ncbi:hypothetical protein PENTCL1PPCAC_25996, partial [Pristionchus entomophagus]
AALSALRNFLYYHNINEVTKQSLPRLLPILIQIVEKGSISDEFCIAFDCLFYLTEPCTLASKRTDVYLLLPHYNVLISLFVRIHNKVCRDGEKCPTHGNRHGEAANDAIDCLCNNFEGMKEQSIPTLQIPGILYSLMLFEARQLTEEEEGRWYRHKPHLNGLFGWLEVKLGSLQIGLMGAVSTEETNPYLLMIANQMLCKEFARSMVRLFAPDFY